jgi:hypothetical protein
MNSKNSLIISLSRLDERWAENSAFWALVRFTGKDCEIAKRSDYRDEWIRSPKEGSVSGVQPVT